VIRYLITDGKQDLANAARWLADGVDFIQIRERDLSVRELAEFTRAVLLLPNPRGAKILVNDRADVALACGAHGVHLRDGSVSPEVFAALGLIVTVAVHRVADVGLITGADYLLLAPIFTPLSKESVTPALGVEALRTAVGLTSTPILALGGVTRANHLQCVEAGAAGIAGIDYFVQAPRT
jgi:thiamine-phosphate pyrophosphorylase